MKNKSLSARLTPWRRILAGKMIPVILLVGSGVPAFPATVLVRMVNFAFQPPLVTVNAGDTVLWTNTTLSFHNVVSSNNVWSPPALFTSPGTFQFTFTSAGTYGYYCSPHHSFGMVGVVTVQGGGNQPPTVALTNPPAGTTLAAPATITLAASAGDPDGSVTNVEFFSGTTLLGSATAAPYQHVVSDLQAGSYDFSALATDNLGLTRTSAVVTVSVVTPGPISFDPSLLENGGRLALRVTVTPGLRYALEYTTNFTSWQPFTNFVATNAVMEFTTPTTSDDRRFYQARLLPNP